jgi:hypothetical protein
VGLFGFSRLLGIIRELVVVRVVVIGDVVHIRIVGFGLAPGLTLLGNELIVGGTARALDANRVRREVKNKNKIKK